MAAATLASSVVVRGTPVASVAAGKRASARPMRGSALVVRAEGEIAGLSECGKFQELCKAEIPGNIEVQREVPVPHTKTPQIRGSLGG